jgi:Ulp1 family protease
MGGEGKVYAEGLLNWIVDEGREKKQISINKNEWSLIYHGNKIPQQNNGHDCGVFSILCADFLSDNLPLQYSQRFSK